MKTLVMLSGIGLAAIGLTVGLTANAQPPKPVTGGATENESDKSANRSDKSRSEGEGQKNLDETKVNEKSPKNKSGSEGDKKTLTVEQPVTESSVPAKFAADEKAIRKIHDDLVKAYSSDDAKAVAALFGSDGEYINAEGLVFKGRQEIEESLSEYVGDHPGCKLDSEIDAIRFVSPTVALVDGVTVVVHEEGEGDATHCHFAAVYVKTDNKWEVASVRDRLIYPVQFAEDQLSRLDFLKGDWIDEDDNSVVSFVCKPTDNNKFLLREFDLKISGKKVMSGSQRIGWDPISGNLRTWIFDSEGGFAEGVWEQDGDDWVLSVSGVTADGETASGSSIYKIVNEETLTWQAVDHEVGGIPVPDSPVFTLTRRGPAPTDGEESKNLKQAQSK